MASWEFANGTVPGEGSWCQRWGHLLDKATNRTWALTGSLSFLGQPYLSRFIAQQHLCRANCALTSQWGRRAVLGTKAQSWERQKTRPACHPGDTIFLKCLMTLAAAELKNIKKLSPGKISKICPHTKFNTANGYMELLQFMQLVQDKKHRDLGT